jgi:hypothetical protein
MDRNDPIGERAANKRLTRHDSVCGGAMKTISVSPSHADSNTGICVCHETKSTRPPHRADAGVVDLEQQ